MIVNAAIRLLNGKIYTGKRHGICIGRARNALASRLETRHAEQGFVTEDGTFLTREAAKEHAILAKQISPDHKGTLYSEDLWEHADE